MRISRDAPIRDKRTISAMLCAFCGLFASMWYVLFVFNTPRAFSLHIPSPATSLPVWLLHKRKTTTTRTTNNTNTYVRNIWIPQFHSNTKRFFVVVLGCFMLHIRGYLYIVYILVLCWCISVAREPAAFFGRHTPEFGACVANEITRKRVYRIHI